VVMAIAMAWSLFGGRQRVPTGALGLALLAAAPAVLGDFQHANTNVFAMGFLVGHMWLSGRGRDVLAGAALALAVCVKVTPALFLPYWLYQRNWKLLGGAAAGLVLLVAAMPAALLGPARAAAVTTQWVDRLVLPNVGSASWYPQHVN